MTASRSVEGRSKGLDFPHDIRTGRGVNDLGDSKLSGAGGSGTNSWW
jgi:hypothetical protein